MKSLPQVEPEIIQMLDDEQSVAMVRQTILAAYRQGNLVIVGRGGQAILRGKPRVLHVRI
ncbi:MAG: cytidylate kinase family protein, partial [Burkholderiales bacterium]